ncbi:hypothetical protein PRIC1_009837 [Phytophthora ramorum]
MADSSFLDDVVGFLHSIDDPALSGTELVRSLDTDNALQLLDVPPLDELFPLKNKKTQQESVSSSSSPAKENVVVDVRSRDAIRRSSYRQKQKAHRDGLLQQVEDLSLQLTLEQSKKEKRTPHTQVWKALANRHLQARHQAEEVHRRLHRAVEKKAKLIQDLGLLIRKRISEEQPEETIPVAKRLRKGSPDRALYEAYMKEMDGLYAQTDRVFKETILESNDEEKDEFYSSPHKVDKNSTYHELVGKSSTPFAFEQVRKLIGRECCMESEPWCTKIDGPWVPEDTTIAKLRVEVGDGSALVQHCILRRYNEPGRVVLITKKFTEGEGAFAGMHSDETGWSIVRPSPVEGSIGTLLESVIRFVPFNSSRAAGSGAAVKHFADVIIRAGEDKCQMCIKMLDEMLLDEALGVC